MRYSGVQVLGLLIIFSMVAFAIISSGLLPIAGHQFSFSLVHLDRRVEGTVYALLQPFYIEEEKAGWGCNRGVVIDPTTGTAIVDTSPCTESELQAHHVNDWSNPSGLQSKYGGHWKPLGETTFAIPDLAMLGVFPTFTDPYGGIWEGATMGDVPGTLYFGRVQVSVKGNMLGPHLECGSNLWGGGPIFIDIYLNDMAHNVARIDLGGGPVISPLAPPTYSCPPATPNDKMPIEAEGMFFLGSTDGLDMLVKSDELIRNSAMVCGMEPGISGKWEECRNIFKSKSFDYEAYLVQNHLGLTDVTFLLKLTWYFQVMGWDQMTQAYAGGDYEPWEEVTADLGTLTFKTVNSRQMCSGSCVQQTATQTVTATTTATTQQTTITRTNTVTNTVVSTASTGNTTVTFVQTITDTIPLQTGAAPGGEPSLTPTASVITIVGTLIGYLLWRRKPPFL